MDPKQIPTQPIDELVNQVENELLEQIINRMEHRELTLEKAQQLAKDFLALLPFEDKRDLLAKLLVLSGTYTEAQGIYLKYAKPYEEEERERLLKLISEHIHKGEIEEAIAVAKGARTDGN